ncbi:MAG: hypothetical protein ACTHN4_01660 [Sphingomicrobium sp.]
MEDWERNFAELSARRHHRRRKKKLQNQAKVILFLGVVVAILVWIVTGAAERNLTSAGGVLSSHGR